VAINPLTLDGQLHGSLAQAVGEMLMESDVQPAMLRIPTLHFRLLSLRIPG
jgi:hypothetical protein